MAAHIRTERPGGPLFDGETIWRPDPELIDATRLGQFIAWLQVKGCVTGRSYSEVWDWSVDKPGEFWGSVRDFFSLPIAGETSILDLGDMAETGLPGAIWFPGATLNAADIYLAGSGAPDDKLALWCASQARETSTWTFGKLRSEVARVRRGLVRLGVGNGDRVAAYMPNIPETLVALLATASLGAIWTACAPEFGIRSILDRFEQTLPKVLFVVDGYRYGDKDVKRAEHVSQLVTQLKSLEAIVHLGYLDPSTSGPVGAIGFDELDGPVDPGIQPVPFHHPLWILYSSGTTGLPKAIVHSHGGITLEHHKALALQSDIGADDRFFWFTTTGWMMWNYLISGLSVGATVVLFDGNPGWPDLGCLWQIAQEAGVSAFGASAPFFDSCRHNGLTPSTTFELSSLTWVGSTGAPLQSETYQWIARHVGRVPISSISGGTDVCTAFVGGASILPVHSGVIPCRFLGADVRAFDARGQSVVGVEGELVVTKPMPSMPVGLWGDNDGTRYVDSYFTKFPGVWWHGDWITLSSNGECVISGRSDATLNRGGVRLGTADFYRVIEEIPAIADSLVIHLDTEGQDELVVFVVTRENNDLTLELATHIRSELRSQLSPRHVPDQIIAVDEIPRTLSGKKTEIPIKRILLGATPHEVIAPGALANPRALDAFVTLGSARTNIA